MPLPPHRLSLPPPPSRMSPPSSPKTVSSMSNQPVQTSSPLVSLVAMACSCPAASPLGCQDAELPRAALFPGEQAVGCAEVDRNSAMSTREAPTLYSTNQLAS